MYTFFVSKQKCIDYIQKITVYVSFLSYTFFCLYPNKMRRFYKNKNNIWYLYPKNKNLDYKEKWPLMVIFLYNLYIFVWIQHMGFTLYPSNCVIKSYGITNLSRSCTLSPTCQHQKGEVSLGLENLCYTLDHIQLATVSPWPEHRDRCYVWFFHLHWNCVQQSLNLHLTWNIVGMNFIFVDFINV